MPFAVTAHDLVPSLITKYKYQHWGLHIGVYVDHGFAFFLIALPALCDYFTLQNLGLEFWMTTRKQHTAGLHRDRSWGRSGTSPKACCALINKRHSIYMYVKRYGCKENQTSFFQTSKDTDTRSCLLRFLISGQLFSHTALSTAEKRSGPPAVMWDCSHTCWKAFPCAQPGFSDNVQRNIIFVVFFVKRLSG